MLKWNVFFRVLIEKSHDLKIGWFDQVGVGVGIEMLAPVFLDFIIESWHFVVNIILFFALNEIFNFLFVILIELMNKYSILLFDC